MQRTVRWLVAVLVSLIVFGGCAVLFMTVRFPWTPSAESDRWSVSFAIAGFVGAAVGGPLVWWAQRERPEPGAGGDGASSGRVSQQATLGKNSRKYMAGRDLIIQSLKLCHTARRWSAVQRLGDAEQLRGLHDGRLSPTGVEFGFPPYYLFAFGCGRATAAIPFSALDGLINPDIVRLASTQS